MDFYRIIVLLPFLFFLGCAGLESVLNPTDPENVVAVPQDLVEQISTPSYKFEWPDLVVCPKTPNAYICVTANTKEKFVVSLDDWEENGWDQEMVNIDRGGLSRVIAEVKTLCKQNFNPQLECSKIMRNADFLENLLEKGEN